MTHWQNMKIQFSHVILCHLSFLLHDGEYPLDADADAHTWHFPALRVEHADQAVVATPSGHAAHADTLLCGCTLLGFIGDRGNTCLCQHCLINDSCVIVQTTGQTEVEHHLEMTENEK